MYKSSMYNNLSPSPEGGYEIYNSMTKACIVVEDKDYIAKSLRGGDESSIKILFENGFIVDETLDEANALKYVYNKRYFGSNGLGVILLPTLACNFNCPYCFEKPSLDKITFEHPNYFQVVEKYIINASSNYRHVYLNFFGGEPLLKKHQMAEFTRRIKRLSEEKGFTVESTIVTNGSLIDESVMESLIRVNCSLIQITIDGSKTQHNTTRVFKTGAPSFDLLIEKIRLVATYVEKNPTIRLLIRFNLNNTSLGDIESTLLLFHPDIRKNISLLFRPVYTTKGYHEANNNGYDELALFNELGHRLGYTIYKNRRTYLSCEACGDTNVVHILPDLSLWKCVNDFSFEEARLGQLNEDGEAQWDTDRVLKWYQYADFLNDEKCRTCAMSPDCLGGCIRNYALTRRRRCGSLQALSSPYRY